MIEQPPFETSITFNGQVTPKIYAKAARAHLRGMTSIGVMLSMAALWGTVQTIQLGRSWFAPVLLFFFGLWLIFTPEISAWFVLSRSPILRDPYYGFANSQSFVTESPNGRTQIVWPKFFRALLTNELALLYTSPAQFIVVSLAFFSSDGEWQQFKQLVAAKVPLRKRGRSPVIKLVATIGFVVAVFLVWALLQAAR
jgi:hypothetical protein